MQPSLHLAGSGGVDPATGCNCEDDDDGDYVYDTYIRYDGPADVLLHDPMSSAATAATAAAVLAERFGVRAVVFTGVAGGLGPGVNVGDVVIYSKYGGTEVKYGGEEYLVLSARDLLAVVEK